MIPARTLDAGQQTVILLPAVVAVAPGLGVQVVRMVPISRARMLDAANDDGQDRRYGEWSPMTLLGRSPRGLVLCLMFVSCPLRWRRTVMCV